MPKPTTLGKLGCPARAGAQPVGRSRRDRHMLADLWSIMLFCGRNIVHNAAQYIVSCRKSAAETLLKHNR